MLTYSLHFPELIIAAQVNILRHLLHAATYGSWDKGDLADARGQYAKKCQNKMNYDIQEYKNLYTIIRRIIIDDDNNNKRNRQMNK